ncbi:MAG: hypothetical protein AMJ90_03175 [candidate division Zixibacteria bacterium SM23_73_2]|nr:MAG: hypothetical protein AMJ90_03175 [candidate division Zixibacteria bacterium SM23_73_2]
MRKTNSREIALKILKEIETELSFANETILRFSKRFSLSDLDRRFITEIVVGTTKYRKRIDYLLGFVLKKDLLSLTPWIRNILRMGIYQIDFMDRIPHPAAVDESVKLALKFGHKGTSSLVNAVLRNFIRDKNKIGYPKDKSEYLSVYYSFPQWMINSWLSSFGEEDTVELCRYFNRRPNICFRVNSLKADLGEFEKALKNSKLKYQRGLYLENFFYLKSQVELENFLPFQAGGIYLQDESAGLPVLLLAPKPKENILDLCVAPGGKAGFMAELMDNKGRIRGVDISEKRLETTRENLNRLGIKIVELICADAKEFSFSVFDRILLDAPCTGLGVLGRNADLRWRKKSEEVKRLAKLQLEILLNTADLVKRSGALVYSTCTLTREENDGVVEKFLEKRDDFKKVSAKNFIDKKLVDEKGMVRTFPFEHKLDGSFTCRLERI